ncbi:Uncharacterised protein [Porphyromonas cangingivalis]|uniref:Uncharacterized protein n=1 Tax=Porphyromonas cangingivalis TaxID=36874 RepID=A0A1T4JXV1_PORCN|nr:hypothetical protein SAMN02745205_00428 [Porphyromonas cangingivalis]VEJ03208.1 Uncharacterised protein [Porphyromonas cangingivalis]
MPQKKDIREMKKKNRDNRNYPGLFRRRGENTLYKDRMFAGTGQNGFCRKIKFCPTSNLFTRRYPLLSERT